MSTEFKNIFEALSWTLLHSVWLGLILTIAAALTILLTRKLAAAIRYNILLILFISFLVATSVVFCIELLAGVGHPAEVPLVSSTITSHDAGHHNFLIDTYSFIAWFLNKYSHWLVAAWLAVLCFKLYTLGKEFRYVSALRRVNTSRADEQLIRQVHELAEHIGIFRIIKVFESATINVPLVIGHLKPIILIPVGMTANLTAGEVEAVLLHELAHIRRNDYLINMIQRISEIIFFFNPGLRWTSALLRIERENCCDDIAVNTTKSKVQLVEALIRFREDAMSRRGYAMGLFSKRNLLLHRVSRMVYNKNSTLHQGERIFFALSFLFIGLWLLISFNQEHKPLPEATAFNIDNVFRKLPANRNFSEVVKLRPDDETANSPLVDSKRSSTRRNSVLSKKINLSNSIAIEPLNEDESYRATITQSKAAKEQTSIRQGSIEQASQVYNARFQAEKDRAQAILDRVQAEKDREQANKDRMQSETDRANAEKDRAVADQQRRTAEKERQQAEIDRKQAEKDRAQADKDRVQADKDRIQAQKDREQAERDRALAQQKTTSTVM
jgi:bla regulator protein blaR1